MSSSDDRHRRPVSRAGWAVVAALAVLVGTASPAGAARQADGQWWHTQWRMDEVWPITGGSGVTVAVLDSGVQASVPELAGAVIPGTDLVGDGGDGTTDRDPGGGHGTAMATLIAGQGGNRGIRGVAPEATILPVTVSSGGDVGPDSDVAADRFARGIRYAADQGAAVVNLSQGSQDPLAEDGCPAAVTEAVRYAASRDVIVVASSGNTSGGLLKFPGSCPGVLTVGANDPQLEPWVNTYRSEHVDVSAAGVDITLIGRDGGVYTGSGTSSATALVSGAVALVRAEFPDASADDVLARILHTVRDIHIDGRDDATGYGVVRPYQALTESVPPDAPNPVWADLEASAPEPTATPTAPGGTSPGLAQGPPSDRSDQAGLTPAMLFAIVLAGLLVLSVLAGAVVLLVALTRRRPATSGHHPPPPPGPAGPPPGPSGPAGPSGPPGPPSGPGGYHGPPRAR